MRRSIFPGTHAAARYAAKYSAEQLAETYRPLHQAPRTQTSRDFNGLRSNPATGWRTPRASRKHTLKGGRNPNKVQPDFHRKTISIRRFLLTSRPISYIMLTRKSG